MGYYSDMAIRIAEEPEPTDWRWESFGEVPNYKNNCGHCHTCGTRLQEVLDGEEWCNNCGEYRRYRSHGWGAATAEDATQYCPNAGR